MCWPEGVYLRKFLLTNNFKCYKFEGFTNPLLLSIFSTRKSFDAHLSGTDLK